MVIIIQAQKSLLSLLSHRSLLSLLSLHHRRVNKLYPLIYKKGYSNGLLEQNEGKGKGEPGPPGLPWIGFRLTGDGNFDIENKRLKSVSDPIETSNAATKSYVDNHLGNGPSSDVSKAYVDSKNARQDIAIND